MIEGFKEISVSGTDWNEHQGAEFYICENNVAPSSPSGVKIGKLLPGYTLDPVCMFFEVNEKREKIFVGGDIRFYIKDG